MGIDSFIKIYDFDGESGRRSPGLTPAGQKQLREAGMTPGGINALRSGRPVTNIKDAAIVAQIVAAVVK